MGDDDGVGVQDDVDGLGKARDSDKKMCEDSGSSSSGSGPPIIIQWSPGRLGDTMSL